jgi:hypothetical protein
MEDGTLHVCAVLEGRNIPLWECREMSVVQWERLCGLLQQSAVPSLVVWTTNTYIPFFGCRYPYILERPEVVEIDYLWKDLDAVRQFLQKWECLKCAGTEVFKRELERRQSWIQGLRRVWLVATLV